MINTYQISLADAIDFVKAFTEELGHVAQNEALGGTISKPAIDGRSKELEGRVYTGNMAWFCYNYFYIPNYPKLFLAFEENNDYIRGQLIPRPDSSNLRCPRENYVFTYDNTVTVDELLKNHVTPITEPIDQEVSRPMVEQYNNNYRIYSPASTLNYFPYGFFENELNQDVNKFLNQPGLEYIRYYFGYGRKTEYENSRVRIILVGVDGSGKNMVPTSLKPDKDDSIILQKSWP